jgi:hypothetical protein
MTGSIRHDAPLHDRDRVVTRGLLLGIVLVVVGCAEPSDSPQSTFAVNPSTYPDAPAVVRERVPLPFCGGEQLDHGNGANVAGRQCFWSAYLSRQPAEFASTETTAERNSVLSIYRVLPNGQVEIFVDQTRAIFQTRVWLRLTCPRLAINRRDPQQLAFGPNSECVETRIS